VAPEHLEKIRIRYAHPGHVLPLDFFGQLQAARISKTNIVVDYDGHVPEWVTPEFASWESPLYPARPGWKLVSFFHGMDGTDSMSPDALMRAAFGDSPPRVISARTRTWDTDLVHGAATGHRDGYTTLPGVGQGLRVAQFAYQHYLSGRHEGPLWFANHVTGCGCYMHNAALGGYLAARDLLRSRGYPVREFPAQTLFGIPLNDKLIEQLDPVRETVKI